ncbi:MAG: GNAT family N-acetyltransferase [Treponema sp.]|nr:GNAT family N-acetyltransferase [Treponema sp.]
MIIKELDYNTYKGQKYQAEIVSDRFLSIEPSEEGFLEKWNNRFVIANICVFDGANRRSGIGTKLMEAILQDAKKSGAIGFDRYCYSNKGPEEHNMRVEMGKFMAC